MPRGNPHIVLRPMKIALALTTACALIACTVATAQPEVNAAVSPVTITVPTSLLQATTVRVTRADGTVEATLPPIPIATTPGTVTVVWNGGRGTGGTGQLLPDGEYRLDATLTDGTVVAVTPPSVTLDATNPAPVLTPAVPTVPNPRALGIPLRTGGASQVRAIVKRPGAGGVTLATGAWKTAGNVLQLPPALRANRIVGLVSVTAEGKDDAGNIGLSAPVLWSVQPSGLGTVIVHRIQTQKPLVAVTVDDGYGPSEAMRMIASARAAKVTITFCFNAINQGIWSQSFRDTLRTAVTDGVLEVCSHGYSHTTGVSTTEAFGTSDLRRNAPWDALAGYSTAPFYRPPFGAYGPGLRAAAGALGYRYVLMWDVDTNDWRGPPPASVITQRAVGGARRGSIILMHTKPNSAAAFPGILQGLKAKGLRPVGLSELFAAGRPG